MKKLLVLSLTVVMVLAFAAVSMAATVTVGGELNFGKNFEKNTDIDEAVVSFTAQIADDVKAFVKLKTGNITVGDNVGVDDAYVEFTEDYGKITVKKGDYNKQERDIITTAVGAVGSDGLTVVYETKLTDQLTLDLVASNREGAAPGLEYGATLAFDTDNFGFNGSLFRNQISSSDYAYVINGYVKFDALKLFLTWGQDNTAPVEKMLIVGGVYDSADVPFYGRAEYDFEKDGTENNWAIRVGYKVTPNYKFEYQYRHDFSENSTLANYNLQYLKLNVTF